MLEYYLEQLEDLSRLGVELQLKITTIQSNLEKSAYKETEKPASGTVDYLCGPPQELKLTVDIFPPKVRVHPEILYMKNKQAPSTYGQVRDLWFATIMNLLMQNREKLTRMQTFSKALVWFTFYFPDEKVRDVDNFSVKLVNDALVKCKILKDDDHRRMNIVVSADIDQKYPRTEIIIVSDEGQLKKSQPKLSGSGAV